MCKRKLSIWHRVLGGLIVLSVAVGGCDGAQWSLDPKQSATKSDIYKVVCFYPANMWRSFDEAGDRNIEGFTFILYLISSSTERGAHANGHVEVQLFRVDTVGERQSNRQLVYQWSRPTSELLQRNPTKLGHGYQPSVDWGDLDLFGKELEILVRYVAPDGSIIPSRTATLTVPARKL